MRRLLRAAMWIVALLIVAIAAAWWFARPGTPDAFYDAPAQRPAEPGALLRSEPFTKGVPAGTRAWRILYTTTRPGGAAAVASAIVMVPDRAATGPLPVIAWAHGTTGIAPGCAPSVMAAPFANVPAFDKIAGEGWAYVATDYVGLGTKGGHAYLVGDDAARAVLDSVRAARKLPGLTLDSRVVVWGHSQGGNSALWTGMRAAAYAPDVNVAGVAALAPASDLAALFSSGRASMFGKIVSAYVVSAYGAAYPDAGAASYLHGRARLLAGDIAARCVGGTETLFSVAETMLLPRDGIFARDPAEGALGARLRENTPNGAIAAPVLLAQGEADDLVLPAIQSRFVAARCAAGQRIDYRTYAGRDHISLVALDSPLGAALVQWTRERFAGAPAADTCRR
jgi:alpha-beta hydrolase superfamily lysophospholipase